ncbi:MAG TPA: leucine/isoleucine/valine transporter permease subunit [Anaerolineae bacterium]|nr:leucine/isoleucine/valine transporter permease subunit [Anaerolineae bacterium]
MNEQARFNWRAAIRMGLLGGIVALFVTLVGMIEASIRRPVIQGILSLGHTLLLLAYVFGSYLAIRRATEQDVAPVSRTRLMAAGAIGGFFVSVVLVLLVLVGSVANLRAVFVNATPALYDLLTLQLGHIAGSVALLVVGAVIGAVTGLIVALDKRYRFPLILGLALIPIISIFESALFQGRGLTLLSAIVIFVVAAGLAYLWGISEVRVKTRVASFTPSQQRTKNWVVRGVAIIVILMLPMLGTYPAEVLDNVGLYVLMGLGLNIVVGFAGLLDLGYVAFFAIGAYTVGVLTSPEIQWTGIQLSFWAALPLAVLFATLAGVMLGIPVLGMRGDYLAIVTLGFGEIIRQVALSDWLKPYIGGSNGITLIPKPPLGPIDLNTPGTLYYLILAGALIALFVSTRLKDSRMGRAWMAMREDEDVAEAMGINLVRTKLLAFATGAAFSGLAGAIFATKLTSIYPHSFHLLISIYVLCVIIVGGIGSIPGVVVGALAMIGLPEILREFAEYRMLMYGAALVLMMLTRPEGLLPEARRKLELHEEDEVELEAPDAPGLLAVAPADPGTGD